MSRLIPADERQCQAEKPSGATFMTLGGVVGKMFRCTAQPVVIATEKYGLGVGNEKGAMSLCADCLDVLNAQEAEMHVVISVIRR